MEGEQRRPLVAVHPLSKTASERSERRTPHACRTHGPDKPAGHGRAACRCHQTERDRLWAKTPPHVDAVAVLAACSQLAGRTCMKIAEKDVGDGNSAPRHRTEPQLRSSLTSQYGKEIARQLVVSASLGWGRVAQAASSSPPSALLAKLVSFA